MSKRNCLLLVTMVVLVSVSTTYAAAVKLDLVKPKHTNAPENASGRAILNHAKGSDKTIIQINCRDLYANIGYSVQLYDLEGGYALIGTIKAHKNGTGTLHTVLSGDHSACRVIVRRPDGNRVLRSFL